MTTPTITIKTEKEKKGKILLELDANKFEKLAAVLGFFNSDFLESLDRAENDYATRRIRKVKSLKELRTR